ncbi:MAG: flagellar hook-associated protein FlgL [bacterium]
MRITNRMMARTMLSAIERNRAVSARLQMDIATTKKVRRPSDDPTGVVQIDRFKVLISRNEQYKKNITLMNEFLTNANTALEQVTDALEEAKNVAVQGASGTLDSEVRTSLAKQVDQLIDVLLDAGNTKYKNRHIFAGTLTTGTTPYTRTDDTITYNGNDKSIKGKIGFETEITYNKTGDQIFNPSGGVDIFAAMVNLKQGLESNDTAAVQTTVTDLTSAIEQTFSNQSELGILQNRLSSTEKIIENENINFADAVSQIQDSDIVEAVVNSQIIKNAISTGLKAMADIIQTSLVNFVS